jgi:hypothetical protein
VRGFSPAASSRVCHGVDSGLWVEGCRARPWAQRPPWVGLDWEVDAGVRSEGTRQLGHVKGDGDGSRQPYCGAQTTADTVRDHDVNLWKGARCRRRHVNFKYTLHILLFE